MNQPNAIELRERFPILERLGVVLRRSEIPVVHQTTAVDCGAACVAMVLGLHGKHVHLEEVRRVMGAGRDGVSAPNVLDAARHFELRGRGVRLDLHELGELERGAILHWNLNHFVVLEGLHEDGVAIVDPAHGRRVAPLAEVQGSFTGVAILLETTEQFTTTLDTGKRKTGRPVMHFLRHVLGSSGGGAGIIGASLLLQLFNTILPFINGRLVDRVVPRGDHHLFAVLVAALGVVMVLSFVTSMLRNQLLLQLRTAADAKLTMGFLDTMLRLPLSFFQQRQAADLAMRLQSIAVVREVMTSSVLSALIDGILVTTSLVFLCVMSAKLAAVSFGLVVVESLAFLAIRKKNRDLAAGSIAKQVEAQNHLQELLQGIESLKAAGHEQRASQPWAASYVDYLNTSLRRGAYASWSESLFGTLRIVGPFVLLVVGVLEVLSGAMTLGSMLSATAFAHGFMWPMANLLSTFGALQTVVVHLNRIDDVLATTPEQDRALRKSAPPLSGRIDVQNVSFRYAPRSPLVLQNVSLSIPAGALVAIVGRSGCGKSTLAALMLGLQSPTNGNILFDGQRLADLELAGVRRQLGVVVQRPHVFGSTIRSNIALGDPSVPLERVVAAAKLACVHDDIAAMPMGYDTPLVAGGGNISGGQQQRIALARALLGDPAVLLLDEATSALDSATESRLQQQLSSLKCTRVVIAHRLSTVVDADLIVVVDGGKVLAQGKHGELLETCAFYRELVGISAVAPAAIAHSKKAMRAPKAARRALPDPERTIVEVAHWHQQRRNADEITVVEKQTRVIHMRSRT